MVWKVGGAGGFEVRWKSQRCFGRGAVDGGPQQQPSTAQPKAWPIIPHHMSPVQLGHT